MFSGLFAFLGRLMLALIFVLGGLMKLGDPAGTGQYMATVGLLYGNGRTVPCAGNSCRTF